MKTGASVLRPQTNWENLYFYQKAVVLYQMTVVFCRRFLPKYGDRTVDQMVQAARSGKQNIVEGFADGVTSTEMELKLLNVARASIKELKEDYLDYLAAHRIRERMTAVRLGRRQSQNEEIAALKAENARLQAEIASLRRELAARGAGDPNTSIIHSCSSSSRTTRKP